MSCRLQLLRGAVGWEQDKVESECADAVVRQRAKPSVVAKGERGGSSMSVNNIIIVEI